MACNPPTWGPGNPNLLRFRGQNLYPQGLFIGTLCSELGRNTIGQRVLSGELGGGGQEGRGARPPPAPPVALVT